MPCAQGYVIVVRIEVVLVALGQFDILSLFSETAQFSDSSSQYISSVFDSLTFCCLGQAILFEFFQMQGSVYSLQNEEGNQLRLDNNNK